MMSHPEKATKTWQRSLGTSCKILLQIHFSHNITASPLSDRERWQEPICSGTALAGTTGTDFPACKTTWALFLVCCKKEDGTSITFINRIAAWSVFVWADPIHRITTQPRNSQLWLQALRLGGLCRKNPCFHLFSIHAVPSTVAPGL